MVVISLLLRKKTCLQEPGADLVAVRSHSAWGQPSLRLIGDHASCVFSAASAVSDHEVPVPHDCG